MLNNQENFIKTTDSETAQKLRDEGLVEVKDSSNAYVFVNEKENQNNKVNFSENGKVCFSNKVCI